jgi:GNAT superfamily N-acetyltransferase
MTVEEGAVTLRPAGEGGAFYDYLGYRERADEDIYPKAEIWNAWVGGRMVGSIVFGPDYGAMWVYHVFVVPGRRGRGIGRRLMGLVVEDARHEGLTIDGDFDDALLLGYLRRRVEASVDAPGSMSSGTPEFGGLGPRVVRRGRSG